MRRTCEKCNGQCFIPQEGQFPTACPACDGNGYAYDWERNIQCPYCEAGNVLVDEDHGGIYARCEWCDGNGNYTERGYNDEAPEGHTGFWLGTEAGTVHVLGDPNMSEKTAGLINEMVKAVYKRLGDGSEG